MKSTPKLNIIREIEEFNRCLEELASGNFEKLGSEKWIKENSTRLQTVIDSLPLYIFYKDKELRLTKINKSFAESAGIPQDEILNKTSTELFPNLPTHYIEEELNIIKTGNPLKEIKEFFFFKDGIHWLQVEKFPFVSESGEVTGIVVVAFKAEDSLLTEESVNESEEKYISLFNNAFDCIYIMDFEGNFLDANKSALDLFKFDKNEIIKLNIKELLNPAQIPSVEKTIEKIKSGKEFDSPLKLKLKNKEGEFVHIETKSSVINQNGKPYLILGIARDITKKLLVEEALRKSELIFRSVWENSVDAMRLIDDNGIIILVNDAFCKMSGKSREELEGKHFSVIYKNKDGEDLLTNVTHHFVEKELDLWNGKKVWFELSNTFLESSDSSPLLFSVFRDITSRKKIEAELRTERDLIKSILESSPYAVLFLDAEGKVIDYNKVTRQILAFDNKEMLRGKSILDYVPEYQRQKVREVFKRTVETGIVKDFEFTLINCQMDELIIELSTNSVKNEIEKTTFIIAILRDVTQRRSAEKQLRENSEELKELNASKDKFFSIISHDLRSPFQGLLGLSDLLASDSENLSQEEVVLISRSINKSLKNQLKLLENLLQWSRMQTGRISYEPEKLNISELVEETFILLGSNAANKGIEFINNVQGEKFVYADVSMISSTLQNIINNAVKFTNHNGKVCVSVEDKLSFFEVHIADTGIGMSEEDRNKLFRIDQHHTTAGTENETGTGLGLILCKEMIERNGGTIKVESELGRGTTFSFTLPKFPGNGNSKTETPNLKFAPKLSVK